MVFEFVGAANMIHVTAQYSNAVIVALLPYVSDYAHRLNLPVPHPVTAADVVHASVLPWLDKDGCIGGAGIGVRGGYGFTFQFGYINSFGGPHSFYNARNPEDVPKFYGEVKMSKAEAVALARDALTKLGIPLELVFAEQEPSIRLPVVDGNTVARYFIEWSDIWPLCTSVKVEIDAGRKTVERVDFTSLNLHRPSPRVAVVPPSSSPPASRVNPEYAARLAPVVLRAVDEYARKLSLPVPDLLSTNQVERFILSDEPGGPVGSLKLTNGWWFLYRNSTIQGFYAPGSLPGLRPFHNRVLVKDLLGKWNLTQTQAIQLVARTLAKLNYPTNVLRLDFEPRVVKPAIPGIPRYNFEWTHTPPSRHSETEGDVDYRPDWSVWAEVDADKGELKELRYYANYGDRPPALGVPISLPVEGSTDQAPAVPSGKRSLRKPPARPQSAFTAPLEK